MELLHTEDVASVVLFNVRMSEGELQSFAVALHHLLTTLSDKKLHAVFNAPDEAHMETPADTREFLQGTYEELMNLITENCLPEYLPRHFREWQGEKAEPTVTSLS